MELKAVKRFKDKNSQKRYEVGEAIIVEDLDRINDLVSRGICIITAVETQTDEDPTKIKLFEKEFEPKEVKEALKTIGVTVAANAKAETVEKKVSELTEEQTEAIKAILCKE